ncbi:hypothetical protein SISNIDRAFT_209608 [Sistotremastrum niveocremeum HHB9708]|uniref:Uncharacterized protein n=1 Tax=Sistotremastrum niveocremeum HHB9708 TaxID=1314777 RepID=A0A164QZJ0_9AGAM|nr:hypothetical protein SISNIDRAFT_209608 [Sistotremastrum niveocremeum HHB9708]
MMTIILILQQIPNLAHEPHHRVVQLSNLLSFNAAEIQRLNDAVRARDEAYQSREKSYQEQLARRQMNYHKHTAEVEELAASYKTKYEKNLEQFAHLDMIRTVYETASQRNTELEIENSTLVERNSILEGQVKDGINQNRIFYETQIQALKAALSITTSRATLFQQLAHRTEQFNVRQRAAQEPVLRREVEVLTAEVTQLRKREEELVEQINSEVRAKRDDEALDGLRMEVMRLGDVELELRKKAKVLKTELENTRKAWQNRELSLQRTERVYAEDAEKVLLCRWAINEQGDSCMVERQNRKELQEHVMHDHLQYFESVDTPDISF